MLKEAPRKYNIIQTKDVKLTLIVDIVDKVFFVVRQLYSDMFIVSRLL